MRQVQVRATWTSVHTIEVPDEAPRIDSDDLDTLIEYEDINSGTAELTDWEITDPGPKED